MAVSIRFAHRVDVGELSDGLEDAAEVDQGKAVAIQEIAQGELAFKRLFALAQLLGEACDQGQIRPLQKRYSAATTFGQVWKLFLPAIEPGTPARLRLGHGGETRLVCLHQ